MKEELDIILDNIFPNDEQDIEITEEFQMSNDQRIEILNILVTDLLTTVETLADELTKLKDEIKNDREDNRRKNK